MRRRSPNLTPEQRAEITKHLENNSYTTAQLAEKYGVSKRTILNYLPPSRRTGRGHAALQLAGQQFGVLTVIERAPSPGHLKSRYTYWKCLCGGCGKECVVRGTNLTSGNTKGCPGCRWGT